MTTDLADHRLVRVHALGAAQAAVVSRQQLYALGVPRGVVRANVRARRWQSVGSQSISLVTGPLTRSAQEWAAVFEAGPRAYLDGTSALIASGLTGYREDTIRVSVPRGARVRRAPGMDIRQTRRWVPEDVLHTGVPRTRPPVAAIRGALWARSDRQAALVLTITVQQGLATAEQLAGEMLRVRRDKRRRFLQDVLLDLLGGVRALGELDFARMCRRRGLPEPSRQVVRRGRTGRYYLDVYWDDWGVVVEIDGIHHVWAQSQVADALRHNDVTLANTTVLHLPLLGLRVTPEEFFDQIERALRAKGCPLTERRPA